VIPPLYRTWWFVSLSALALILLIFGAFRYRFRQLQREKMLAQNFSRRLIESQEQERGRIAAELHDGLSQSLVIIKNRAAISLNKKENAEHAFEQLEEIAQASTEAIDETKEIIYNLRPIQLDRLGLTKAILAMFRRVSETHEIEFQTDIEPLDGVFSKKAESSIYRILQESVNNIVRHSQASQVVVKIKRNVDEVEILLQDNGTGFRIEPNKDSDRSGFGLTGIKERAKLLDGEASVESEIGKGTVVRINLPIKNDDDFNS
jgi:signal transduction histidine kinase